MIRRIYSLSDPIGQKQIIQLAILSAFAGLTQGLAALCLVPIIDALVLGNSAWHWIGTLIALALLSGALQYLTSMACYNGAFSILRHLYHAVGNKLARLPLGWFEKPREGELSQFAAKGALDIGATLAHHISPVIIHSTTIGTIALGTWAIDWRLGLALTLIAPLFALLVIWSSSLADTLDQRNHAAEVDVNTRIIEFSRCQGALRSAGRSSNDEVLTQALTHQLHQGQRIFWRQLLANIIGSTGAQIAAATLVLTAAFLLMNNTLDAYRAIALIGLALRFTQPLSLIASLQLTMRQSRAQIRRAQSVLEGEELPEAQNSASPTCSGAISFENVSFSYQGARRPVFTDMSFTVQPGTMTALVGPSGSGKTTIARLIARFYDADSGKVCVDGTDVRDIRTEDLMARLSMVFQDVYLFDDSLEENIRVGRPAATDDEVAWAASLAGVDEIIRRLPNGGATRVGEGGTSLSGGERQRVSVARALLKHAPIVLFDEATSALDAANEHRVTQAMAELRRDNATLLVIAHKLSTVVAADQILVLGPDGQIEARGTHDELLAAGGRYAEFWYERGRAAQWHL
ncbi:MAG: ABC transporter ATP-binding protein [Actinomycetaceae bacterium]|nr:ABC transporter ATP-binding protein [Actinomycetaceae bacterium]